MTHERKTSTLRFDESQLAGKGFEKNPDGSWSKPSTPALDRLAARKHPEQKRTLERKKSKKPKSPKGGGKRDRRKRPAEVIVTMTAHLPRYFDDDNLAGALKPLRDALADWIGVDDGDRRVMWECDQTLTRGAPGVCVVIRDAS